jgi:opacity protein-like surface antigen
MVKFYPISGLFVEAGPQVGFLISANSKEEGSSTVSTITGFDEEGDPITTTVTTTIDSDEDVKDAYKTLDFGFNFGAGYDFTENLFVSARYNAGLSNVSDVSIANILGNSIEFDAKNSVISLSVGYKF